MNENKNNNELGNDLINNETDKGTHFSALDNEEKKVKVNQLNRELQKQKKEVELKQEIEKSLEIKKQHRKNIEKRVVLIGSLFVILGITYMFSTHFIRKPFEYKYELLYLYDLSNITTKQQTSSHNSYITYMNLAEKNHEDLEEATHELFYELKMQHVYESNKKTIQLLKDSLPNTINVSTKYKQLNNLTFQYFTSINDLNELLLEAINMDFDEYKEEYIKRLKTVNTLNQQLTSMLQ